MRKTNINEVKTTKTTPKSSPKTTPKKTENEQVTLDTSTTEKSVKTNKNKPTPKNTPKKNEVVTEKEVKGIIPLANMLPTTLEVSGVKFKEAPEIKTYDDLLSLYENEDFEDEVFIAGYWNKRHLAQYNYAKQFSLNKFNLKGFENNLDMLSVVYVSDFEGEPCAIALSTYTGALYKFYGDEIPEIVDEDENYRLRVSNGMEFQFYVAEDVDLKKYLK